MQNQVIKELNIRNAYAEARAYAEKYLQHDQQAIFALDLDEPCVRLNVTCITTSEFYVFFACYEHVCVEGINDTVLIVRLLNEACL